VIEWSKISNAGGVDSRVTSLINQQQTRCPSNQQQRGLQFSTLFFYVASYYYCCITAEQLPPPADAEKRDTVPYVGRWQ